MEDFKNYLRHHSKSLREGYCWCVRLFLEWLAGFNLDPQQLQLSHFQGYINHLQEEDCKGYKVRLTIAALRNYGHMLVLTGKANEKLAMELYIKSVHKEPFPSLFEWDELEQINQEFSTPGIVGQRNKVVLNLLVYQGLTPEEVINLYPQHFDLKNKTLSVPDTYQGNSRTLILEPHQLPLIGEYNEQIRPRLLFIANKEDDRFFVTTSDNPNGKYLTDNLLSSMKSKYPQIASYAQIRASILYRWYTLYGLEETIRMAGHEYIPQSPTKQRTP